MYISNQLQPEVISALVLSVLQLFTKYEAKKKQFQLKTNLLQLFVFFFFALMNKFISLFWVYVEIATLSMTVFSLAPLGPLFTLHFIILDNITLHRFNFSKKGFLQSFSVRLFS